MARGRRDFTYLGRRDFTYFRRRDFTYLGRRDFTYLGSPPRPGEIILLGLWAARHDAARIMSTC